ncbi:MAG: 2-amino-4-hydroxy-6-hydroxymethyldihydropteridine diphosphokinase [Pseudomonadales bacterium]|nr:2-amino-4-hydroxy-6-hydroxymethyldihydropteridine diphosphokinase [Pseudomonadales bacterium]
MATQQHQVIVAVGSNIKPETSLRGTRAILESESTLIDEATLIQTEPDGYQDQPDFLNGAYLLQTELPYAEFNAYLKTVETRMGRVKGPIRSGPRTVDLDIIIWDGKVVHEDYRTRKYYVVQPVEELLERHGIQVSDD